MVFGDGDGKIFNDFTSRIDVTAHELTHGVTEKTAGLEYQGQSGALNESCSDVFGIMVKQWKLGQSSEDANWLIGEGIWAKGINGRALRDMQNPGTAYDDPKVGKDPVSSYLIDVFYPRTIPFS
jgi:Zn-dependent metalloprotease